MQDQFQNQQVSEFSNLDDTPIEYIKTSNKAVTFLLVLCLILLAALIGLASYCFMGKDCTSNQENTKPTQEVLEPTTVDNDNR